MKNERNFSKLGSVHNRYLILLIEKFIKELCGTYCTYLQLLVQCTMWNNSLKKMAASYESTFCGKTNEGVKNLVIIDHFHIA